MIRSVFVTGGTGNQGGSVARNLVREGIQVKVLTRNPSSDKAQILRDLNCEIVKGDLNKPETYSHHVKNSDGVFSLQTYEKGVAKEIQQGIALADLAKEHDVKHFIYSSVIGVDLDTGIPHWESKWKIENHIRQINLPHTIIRPTSLYENFLLPQVKPRILKGKLVVPLDKNVVQQLVSAEEVGMVSAFIFRNPEKYLSRIITLAAEEMSQEQMAKVFSEVLGKEIKFQKLPSIITRLAMGRDLHKMFKWVNDHGGVFVKDMDELKKEFPGMQSLKQWAQQKFTQS